MTGTRSKLTESLARKVLAPYEPDPPARVDPHLYPAVIKLVLDQGFRVIFTAMPVESGQPVDGRTTHPLRTVELDNSRPHTGAELLEIAAHEYGHVIMHNPDRWSSFYFQEDLELEAEMFAHLLLTQLGVQVDNFSVPYLRSYLGGCPCCFLASLTDPDALMYRARLDRVARKVYPDVERALNLIKAALEDPDSLPDLANPALHTPKSEAMWRLADDSRVWSTKAWSTTVVTDASEPGWIDDLVWEDSIVA